MNCYRIHNCCGPCKPRSDEELAKKLKEAEEEAKRAKEETRKCREANYKDLHRDKEALLRKENEAQAQIAAIEAERERAAEERRRAAEASATQLEELQTKLDGAKAFEEASTQAMRLQKEQHAAAEHAAAEHRREAEALAEQLKGAMDDEQKLVESLTSLRAEVDALKEAKLEEEKAALELHQQGEKTTQELADARAKLQQTEAKQAEMEMTLQSEVDQLKKSLEAAAASSDSAVQGERDARIREREANEKLQACREALDKAPQTHEPPSKKVSDLEERVESLRESLRSQQRLENFKWYKAYRDATDEHNKKVNDLEQQLKRALKRATEMPNPEPRDQVGPKPPDSATDQEGESDPNPTPFFNWFRNLVLPRGGTDTPTETPTASQNADDEVNAEQKLIQELETSLNEAYEKKTWKTN